MSDESLEQSDYIYHGGISFFSEESHGPILWCVKSDPDNWDDIEEKEE